MFGHLRPSLVRTTTAVASNSYGPTVVVQPTIPVPKVTPRPVIRLAKSADVYSQGLLNPRIISSLSSAVQHRLSHTDMRCPSFDNYRKKDGLNPRQSSRHAQEDRKAFAYLQTGALAVAGSYVAKSLVTKMVLYLGTPADVRALSSIEVELKDIPAGKSATVTWRMKPLFVRHRTPEEIAQEESVDLSGLRDPEDDKARVRDQNWLVVIGVCTHLGCVPIPYLGEFGGYYCPCHGSHYDASGRIRKGPAPLNLEVPPYEFISPDVIKVG